MIDALTQVSPTDMIELLHKIALIRNLMGFRTENPQQIFSPGETDLLRSLAQA